ncbi:MAG: TetR/AcrR family transcriptional regulator [Actinomycetota bacterium]|nr:TetR/AcrR family transcriptional regulator [Actinomycetota bacterium]
MNSTKERILETTAAQFRRYGYTGTGMKQIVTEANAPFGSIYHFFPGGKQQLGEETIRRSGEMYYAIFEAVLAQAPDPVVGVRDFFTGAALALRETDYADACPIATVALEVASTSEPLRQATADVFESWVTGAARHFTDAGIAPRRSRELAIELIALLEGAFVLSRAARSTEPLEVAGANAVAAVRTALA